MVTKLFVLERVTSAPPDGAAMFNVTVPVEELPLITVPGCKVSVVTASTGGPHWFGTPPPPQVWPARLVHPQVIVPPHPFGVGPQEGPPEQELGTHPEFTVSGCVNGVCPGELALTVTLVVCGTEFAA
jgi:hypothetical protein